MALHSITPPALAIPDSSFALKSPPMTLEADVAYLHIVGGERQTAKPPHFAVSPAPKKCARGRDRDLLLLAFYLNDKDHLTWIETATQNYFDTPGTVTSATRAAISAVNTKVRELNRWPPASGLVTGGMCCAVVRGNDLYLAHTGKGRALIVRGQDVITTPEVAPAPLGSSQHPDIQYFHTNVSPADFLLLAENFPAGWVNFPNFTTLGLESAVARLTRMSGGEANALVAQLANEGLMPVRSRPTITAAPISAEKKTETLTVTSPLPRPPQPAPPDSPAPTVESVAPESAQMSSPSSLEDIMTRVRATPSFGEPESVTAVDEEEEIEVEDEVDTLEPEPDEPVLIGEHVYEFEEDDPEEDVPPTGMAVWFNDAKLKVQEWFAGLPLNRGEEAIRQRGAVVGAKISSSSTVALSRLLPEGVLNPETKIRIPNSTMMAVAIIIPVVVGLVAGVIYIQRGRNQQFTEYVEAARLEAGLARTSSDPLAAKPHWVTALAYLEQAEAVFPNQPDAAALREEAQQSVDAVEGTQRLVFEAVIPGGFNPAATLTQLVINGNEVYALDTAHNKVYRAIAAKNNKYTLDRTFDCAAGAVGSSVVKRIVDIAWLDTPNIVNQPVLLAVDEAGVLMYCKPDGTPPQASQLNMPDGGWKKPKAISVYTNRIYVLDAGANEIWQYDRSSGVFSERAKRYFTTQTPDLSNAISFAISASGEVYVLRTDGKVMQCTRDAVTASVSCLPNVTFTDSRPSHKSGDRLDDFSLPTEIYFDPPPEPSLYLLDRSNAALYQLSLKMILQKQFKPTLSLGEVVTGMAIGPNKEVYLAAGTNVYVARKP